MQRRRKSAVFGRSLARVLSRLLRIYWTSPDAKRGALLLAGAVALELAAVGGSYLLSGAERSALDALEQRRPADFVRAVALFAAALLGFACMSAWRITLRQRLELRWRSGLTAHYLERWISPRAWCQAKLQLGGVDNPDQRIAEDVRDFVASTLGLSLSLLSAVVTLLSFGGLLYTLSERWPLPFGGGVMHVPGLMLWVALGYALLSTALTHRVGRPLVRLEYDRIRAEADLRYGLVRFRDNIETVALARGEEVERAGVLARFGCVAANWRALVDAQRRLTLVTSGLGQASSLVPLLVAAPAYLAGFLSLGGIAQIRFAYGQVAGALSWLVHAYQEIARWRANIERLASFAEVLDAAEFELTHAGVRLVPADDALLRLDRLRLEGPGGELLLANADASVAAGERIAITGPAAGGKAALLRALGGLWPFGRGRIELPPRARTLFLLKRPYLPHGTLRAALAHPSHAEAHEDARLDEVLRLLRLAHLVPRLDEVAAWDQELAPGDQQLVGIARALLYEPDWVFLDMATSELDEETERRVYELLAERLPRAAVLSVAHRAAVEAYHGRRWVVRATAHEPASLCAA